MIIKPNMKKYMLNGNATKADKTKFNLIKDMIY